MQPLLSAVLYIYDGGVFVWGTFRELCARQPGMMTLIGFALNVAFVYSLAVSAGLRGSRSGAPFGKGERSTGAARLSARPS